jgi:hypothetical protein
MFKWVNPIIGAALVPGLASRLMRLIVNGNK